MARGMCLKLATLEDTRRPTRTVVSAAVAGVRVWNATDGGDLADNDASATWAMSFAAGLNAEISMIGFGAQVPSPGEG